MKEIQNKRILICPLDWGLGHATRCIPIIKQLQNQNNTVVIAADKRPLQLLKKEFPQIEILKLNGYEISYPSGRNMVAKMLMSIPKILAGIYREHQAIKKIIAEKNIDVVISDNRYGLWNKKIKSIFITHQIGIKSPFAEKLIYKINKWFIEKYDECWIPDIEGEKNLSGDLSHKYSLPKNAKYIGWLSRFVPCHIEQSKTSQTISNDEILRSAQDDYIFVILSGPEPQRAIFENKILAQAKNVTQNILVVQGKTEENKNEIIGNIALVSHLETEEMRRAILNAQKIICRSGYSTIMDLMVLGKTAMLVPTSGQTEQEYLAKYLSEKKMFKYIEQDKFDLRKALIPSSK